MTKFKVQAVLTREYEFEIDAENVAQARIVALNQIGEELGIIVSEWTIDCIALASTENRATVAGGEYIKDGSCIPLYFCSNECFFTSLFTPAHIHTSK